jgi:hypothetical protein
MIASKMIHPDGRPMTPAEMLQARLDSSRGMSSVEIGASLLRNRLARLSAETQQESKVNTQPSSPGPENKD